MLWKSAWLSPVLVPLLVLSFGVAKRRREVAVLFGLLAFVFLVWWLTTHRIDRFLIPMLPIAALLAGIGATWNASRVWQYVVMIVMVCVLIANCVLISLPIVANNRFFLSFGDGTT